MIRFLIKGVLRDRSRSLFPVLIIAAGVALTVFLFSWLDGIFDNMISANANFSTGHIKITTRAYKQQADQLPNDLAILGVNELLDTLKQEYPEISWRPRLRFGGLLDIPDAQGETRAQGPVMGIGLEIFNHEQPAEAELFNLQKSLVKGRLPQNSNEILISEQFAKRLQVKVGETATLIGSTMHGGLAVYNFTVSGTVSFGMSVMDRGAMIADLSAVQSALDMDDAAAEILGFFRSAYYDDQCAQQLKEQFNQRRSNPQDEFSPEMQTLTDQNGLGEMMGMFKYSWAIVSGLFMTVMCIVLWNAGLMAGIRRYGEIGVRLAIGENKGHLFRSMLFESIIVGIIGSVIGTLIGLSIGYYLQFHGLDMSSMMKNSSVYVNEVIKTRITAKAYYIGFLPGLLATFFGTALAGIGIYRRQTSQLFKELEA